MSLNGFVLVAAGWWQYSGARECLVVWPDEIAELARDECVYLT